MDADSLSRLDACALSQAIRQREVSCREVMAAYLARIDAFNPQVNAIVSLQPPECLLAEADARDAQLAQGLPTGWMHGFPMAIKDLAATAGVRTTLGSPLFADHVPTADALMVARMKAAGGIVIGKTNVPEFGLGSNSYNPVFGRTGNAWQPALSAGGSSGGAAVSLALRLQPVADGSDMMGSLRNPAAFNRVFGLRPSAGRVPSGPPADLFIQQLSTEGPMGRSVRDVARLLAVQAGRDHRAPLSIAEPASELAEPGIASDAELRGCRIGWLGDLGGHLPIEPGILDACEAGLRRLETIGCRVEPLTANFSPAEVWQTWLDWRRWLVTGRLVALYRDPQRRTLLKPEAIWEVEQGLAMSAEDVCAASLARSHFHQQMLELLSRVDLLVLPSAQVWPFDKQIDWPRSINGVEMDTYHRWMEVVIHATLAGLPALSVPVGFGPQGLPMGMQLIGQPLGERQLLRFAAAYESAIGDWLRREPPLLATGRGS
ncbi:amidase [Piscinibacter sakaiensis]|uniref:amidase n=1 Tax=Piscinibacter sakaiensis TaxID=1547922 RepID=UPI003AAFF350